MLNRIPGWVCAQIASATDPDEASLWYMAALISGLWRSAFVTEIVSPPLAPVCFTPLLRNLLFFFGRLSSSLPLSWLRVVLLLLSGAGCCFLLRFPSWLDWEVVRLAVRAYVSGIFTVVLTGRLVFSDGRLEGFGFSTWLLTTALFGCVHQFADCGSRRVLGIC